MTDTNLAQWPGGFWAIALSEQWEGHYVMLVVENIYRLAPKQKQKCLTNLDLVTVQVMGDVQLHFMFITLSLSSQYVSKSCCVYCYIEQVQAHWSQTEMASKEMLCWSWHWFGSDRGMLSHSLKKKMYMLALINFLCQQVAHNWDCEIMIMLKHNQHHQITFFLCSSDWYNSDTAAKQNLKLMMWRSKAQLNQILIYNGDLKFWFSPSVILLGNIRCLQ